MATDSKDPHLKNQHVKNKIKIGSFFEIFVVLGLGSLVGFLTLAFIKALEAIELLHINWNNQKPYHLLLIPIVLIVIELIKRNTLYFPIKLALLPNEKASRYWSIFMLPIHFFGTLLSHLSGVSVGREGANVLYSAGLIRLFRLEWLYWGPIVCAMGFSAVVGQFWVAPFFMTELFGKTNMFQKIYSLVGSMLAVLILRTFNIAHLFSGLDISSQIFEIGFFKKLLFLFLFSLCAGYLMRLYKKVYFILSEHFKMSALSLKISLALVLAFFLYLPEFRKYQSLGLYQISHLSDFSGTFFDVICKLFLTLISVTLGFLGGEFIPLVYSGVYFGSSFFNYFGYSMTLGSVLGSFLLFAGATRFKWTSYILILNLVGLNWWFWAYFIVAIAIQFSGDKSLYKSNHQ